MLTIVRIAAKDLRQRLRDRSALMIAVVLPLVLAVIYGALFGSASTPRAFNYGVVDLDHGTVSQAFRDDVLRQIEREGFVKVRDVASATEAARLAGAGSVDAAFVLPAGFSAAVRSQAPVAIEVIGNVDSPTGTDVARSIASSFTADLTGVRLSIAAALGTDHENLPAEQLTEVAARAVAAQTPLLVQDVSATAKVLNIKTYFAAGMAVFFLFFTVQFGVTSLVEERAEGTLARLLAAPIRPAAILAGKMVASVTVGLASMAVLVAATTALMRISWGNPIGVALLVLAGVLAASGVTSLVASLARTPDQAGSWLAIVSVLLGLLGGTFFPLAQVGGFAETASLATPHAWFLRGLGELAGGGGPAAVLPEVAAMLAIAAVTLGLALVRLRRVVQP